MTQEEAKQMALDDFKRRKKRLEDWLMKPIQEYKGGHGIVDRLTKK